MNRQTIAIVAGAVVLFAAVIVGTLAATNGGSDQPVHTLPDGQVHTGQLSTDSMTTEDGTMTHEMGSMP